jgi:hypothetical protein
VYNLKNILKLIIHLQFYFNTVVIPVCTCLKGPVELVQPDLDTDKDLLFDKEGDTIFAKAGTKRRGTSEVRGYFDRSFCVAQHVRSDVSMTHYINDFSTCRYDGR